jgi:hypothetical protein
MCRSAVQCFLDCLIADRRRWRSGTALGHFARGKHGEVHVGLDACGDIRTQVSASWTAACFCPPRECPRCFSGRWRSWPRLRNDGKEPLQRQCVPAAPAIPSYVTLQGCLHMARDGKNLFHPCGSGRHVMLVRRLCHRAHEVHRPLQRLSPLTPRPALVC